jgi:hypothetical protein
MVAWRGSRASLGIDTLVKDLSYIIIEQINKQTNKQMKREGRRYKDLLEGRSSHWPYAISPDMNIEWRDVIRRLREPTNSL